MVAGGARTARAWFARNRANFWLWLAAICVAGLLVRVAYVVLLQANHLWLGGDAYIYAGTANNVARGVGWITPLLPFQHVQVADHPPLYILYLAAAAVVDPGPATSQLTFMLWSCVLGTGSVLLCGLAGREIAGKRIGLVAAGLAAVDPNMWVHDGQLLSETMAIFVAAGVILFAYRFWHQPTWQRALWLGVWCGLAALARSELALAVPLVLFPLALLARGVAGRRRATLLGVGVLSALVVVAPWVAFNRTRFRDPVLLSTNFGRTLAAASCHDTYYGAHIGFKSYGCLDAVTKRYITPDMDDSQKDKAYRKYAFHYMGEHVRRVPLVVLARWGRILEVYAPYQEIHANALYRLQGRLVAQFVLYTFYVAALLAIVGAWILRRTRTLLIPLLAFPAIILISVAATFAEQRYRAPAQPALVLLAAVAVDAGVRAIRRRRGRPGDVVAAESSLDVTAGALTR